VNNANTGQDRLDISSEYLFKKLDPSTWRISVCKWFYDYFSNKNNIFVKLNCDTTCEKFRIQRYSKFWDLDINVMIQV
jgi:hypothetical protein